MKTILVGDDKDSVSELATIIGDLAPTLGINILSVCWNGADATDKIATHRPQLVFVDVQSAFPDFVFTTKAGSSFECIVIAPSELYALRAIKLGAIDYLVKPLQAGELHDAIGKVSRRMNNTPAQQLEMLMTYFRPEKPKVRRVALTASDHLIFVDTDDIIYCESDSNYTTFFLTTAEKVVISKTLKDVEELLHDDGFFRIHASYLINLKHVAKFTRGDGGFVVMSNNQNITVSRKKKDEFFERFSKL